MSIFERYLLRMFAKIFLICFLSFGGLFIIVHLFTNFDELLALSKTSQSQLAFFGEFYGPRLLDLFDRTVNILILTAAVFSFAMMQRRRELTAIEAAGISKSRMTRSLLFVALGLIGISIANREILIPKFQRQLTSTAQSWNEKKRTVSNFQKDHINGILIRADSINVESGQLLGTAVQIPMHLSTEIPKIVGQSSKYMPENPDHPAGLLIDRVTEPKLLPRKENLANANGPVVIFPRDAKWLKPNQCFVATNLTLEELAFGQDLNEYVSLPEMIESLQRPTQWYSRSNRITVHSRLTRPVLDLTLLLFALPLVIRFSERNLFAAVLACVGSILLFQIAVMACQVLGSFSLIPTASLTAWLPIIFFLPATVWTWNVIDG